MAGFTDIIMRWLSSITPQLLFQLATFCVCIFLVVDMAKTQISPGDLHKTHEFLEGLKNCDKCHNQKSENMAENCLSCHGAIKQQLLKSKGLHAQKEFARCELCHTEHQGKDFELIFFKGGTETFDHTTTGYKLEGKHASADCRSCHNPKNLQNAKKLKDQSVSIERTYLGLEQSCLSCHIDEHRGQLPKDCAKCHSFDGWNPVPKFDHYRTDYPLTGQHQKVDCAKCHHQIVDKSNQKDSSYLLYGKLKHDQCSDCHKDAHENRLGTNCNKCHNTLGWNSVKLVDFDHNRTRYPLLNMHAKVDCEKCHGDRSTKRELKFANCLDCHKDFHEREFANRVSQGACEECHTVKGFLPSTFTMLKHEETLFRLVGAHQAIACIKCHVETSKEHKKYKFSFESLRCPECHKDPHRGQVDRYKDGGGCETCHKSKSWDTINFDHNKTDYPLEGAHIGVACIKCHKMEEITKNQFMHFKPVDTKCASCHSDNVTIERLQG